MIISLAEFSDVLEYRLNLFKQKHSKLNVETTEKQRCDIAYEILDAMINDRLNWATTDRRRVDDLLEKTFPWWSSKMESDQDNEFWSDVIDELYLIGDDQLSMIIPDKTWLVITTRRVGMTLVVSKGEDWRILDWERIQRERKARAKMKRRHRAS